MSLLEIPLVNDVHRKIIHVDMDAFYASIEERDHPQYRHKALMISRDPRTSGGHGVIATANYLARRYGVHSAMSAAEANRLVPATLAVFKKPDFVKYRQVSRQLHMIFHEVTEKIEPVALDEAYLDVTTNKLQQSDTIALACWLQQRIYQTTHLVCSVGISYNKFLAKMASDYRKPHGRTIILPAQAQAFLQQMPINKFHGVGKKTLPKLLAMGITNGKDLLTVSLDTLTAHFGKAGYLLYQHARGIDNRPVVYQRLRKSIGREHTYDQRLQSETAVVNQLHILAQRVHADLVKQHAQGQTIVLKIRDDDFNTVTRRQKLTHLIDRSDDIFQAALQLWHAYGQSQSCIRLLGITLTDLSFHDYENITLPLFNEDNKR